MHVWLFNIFNNNCHIQNTIKRNVIRNLRSFFLIERWHKNPCLPQVHKTLLFVIFQEVQQNSNHRHLPCWLPIFSNCISSLYRVSQKIQVCCHFFTCLRELGNLNSKINQNKVEIKIMSIYCSTIPF